MLVGVADITDQGKVTDAPAVVQMGTCLGQTNITDDVFAGVNLPGQDTRNPQVIAQTTGITKIKVGAHVQVDTVGREGTNVGCTALRPANLTVGPVCSTQTPLTRWGTGRIRPVHAQTRRTVHCFALEAVNHALGTDSGNGVVQLDVVVVNRAVDPIGGRIGGTNAELLGGFRLEIRVGDRVGVDLYRFTRGSQPLCRRLMENKRGRESGLLGQGRQIRRGEAFTIRCTQGQLIKRLEAQ